MTYPPVREEDVIMVGAVMERDGLVLLALRNANKRLYPSTWDLPGGHVEAGETAEAALERELIEELGVRPTRFDQIAQRRLPEGDFVVFHVTAWEAGEPRATGDEHIRIAWFSIDEACRLPDLASPEFIPLFKGLRRQGAPAQSDPD